MGQLVSLSLWTAEHPYLRGTPQVRKRITVSPKERAHNSLIDPVSN